MLSMHQLYTVKWQSYVQIHRESWSSLLRCSQPAPSLNAAEWRSGSVLGP